MQEYLLKVTDAVQSDVLKWLHVKVAPTHVRVSTLAPLSNYGYPSGAEAALLRISEHGIVTGQSGGEDKAPHDFVPWQNIAYISDGTGLAKEMAAHNVRVNAVSPGVIQTHFHEQFSTPEMMQAYCKTIPLGRVGTPDEVASVICFLASDAAAFLVGETIEINGGMLME